MSLSTGGGDGGSTGGGATGKTGAGTVPTHFQARVHSALTSMPYAELKRDALQRISRGGPGADLDAPQIAATGVAWDASHVIKPCEWAPMLVLIAEGPERGVQAELIDDDLTALGSIARVAWPELIGRAVGLQLTVDKGARAGAARGVDGNEWQRLERAGSRRLLSGGESTAQDAGCRAHGEGAGLHFLRGCHASAGGG